FSQRPEGDVIDEGVAEVVGNLGRTQPRVAGHPGARSGESCARPQGYRPGAGQPCSGKHPGSVDVRRGHLATSLGSQLPQVVLLTLFLMNFALPSVRSEPTPPG